MSLLEVRSEVVEYGSLPTAPWLTGVDSLHQLRGLILRLLQSAFYEQGRGELSKLHDHARQAPCVGG